MSFIEYREVSKFYKSGEGQIAANNQMSFVIEQGEFVVIVGPSGAGKSTTLNILGGIDQNDEGEVIVAGDNISEYSPAELNDYRRHQIGFIFQNYNLIPNLTALENVEMAAQLVPETAMPAAEALAQVQLSERSNHFPAQLSGGEQQRVAIARAIAKRPAILLCDEPTGALDYETGREILQVLHNLCQETGATVILVTHNSALTAMADRVIRIADAKALPPILNEDPKPISEIHW